MICLIYVDDTIFAGPNQKEINREIDQLGIKQPHEERAFEFHDEASKFSSRFFLPLKLNSKKYHFLPSISEIYFIKMLKTSSLQKNNNYCRFGPLMKNVFFVIIVDLVLCAGSNLCASRQRTLRGLFFAKKSFLKMRTI